ncbi:MAG: hypothetical protein AAF602_30085, partial [Myxococcota bacterium]
MLILSLSTALATPPASGPSYSIDWLTTDPIGVSIHIDDPQAGYASCDVELELSDGPTKVHWTQTVSVPQGMANVLLDVPQGVSALAPGPWRLMGLVSCTTSSSRLGPRRPLFGRMVRRRGHRLRASAYASPVHLVQNQPFAMFPAVYTIPGGVPSDPDDPDRGIDLGFPAATPTTTPVEICIRYDLALTDARSFVQDDYYADNGVLKKGRGVLFALTPHTGPHAGLVWVQGRTNIHSGCETLLLPEADYRMVLTGDHDIGGRELLIERPDGAGGFEGHGVTTSTAVVIV